MDMHRGWDDANPADVAHLHELGVLGTNVQLVHMCRANAEDVDLLRQSGTSVVHCPAASARVAIGVTRHSLIPEMLAAGVNASLGSDSGNYSDFFDVGRQMYLAAVLHREARGDMPTVSAETAFEMATINGALALGIEDHVGSLEEGKRADIVIHRGTGSRPELRPSRNDALNTLVYSAQSVGVDTVLVDGEIVLERGEFTRVDGVSELDAVDRAAAGLRDRMGWADASRWPVIW